MARNGVISVVGVLYNISTERGKWVNMDVQSVGYILLVQRSEST